MPVDSRRLPVPDESFSPYSFAKQDGGARHNVIIDKDVRSDGRKANEMRPIFLKMGVVSQAKGSAYVELDKTKVICAVYGPREVTKREEFSLKGQLFCELKYATFSCHKRRSHQQDNTEKDLSLVLAQALEPAVCLEKFPKARMDVFVNVLEDDGDALGAAITCASAALANAKVEMYDLVIGCAVRQFEGHCLLDPSSQEEYHPELSVSSKNNAGVCVGYMPSIQQVAALIQNGDLDVAEAQKCIKLCVSTCTQIYPVIQQVLAREYKVEQRKTGTT